MNSTTPSVPARSFLTRYDAAKRLGKSTKSLERHGEKWGLESVRINGHSSYTLKSVEEVLAEWDAAAKNALANSKVVAPPGWRLLILNANGPFLGEEIPDGPAAIARAEGGLETLGGMARLRSLIASHASLEEAFRVAEACKLNVIRNGRGIVAVREA